MAKYIGPKVRLSRRVGIPLTPKAVKVMDRKPFRPGVHKSTKTKLSTYGQQLAEVQKVKYAYNITRRQLKRYFEEAQRRKGNTVDNLFKLLESRLDVVLLRAGFVPTIYAAQQLVSHGHVKVNGKKVNIRSFRVKVGDEIALTEKGSKIPVVEESLKTLAPAKYLEVDKSRFTCKLIKEITREDVPLDCQANQVVEFLAR
jgi:small subunit ribosomal protein S4